LVSIATPAARFSATNAGTSASATRCTVMFSSPSPPPSLTFVSPVARTSVKHSDVIPGDE
jgi:hypothetical protein